MFDVSVDIFDISVLRPAAPPAKISVSSPSLEHCMVTSFTVAYNQAKAPFVACRAQPVPAAFVSFRRCGFVLVRKSIWFCGCGFV
jgi:hypothetical protein